jgi:hypothetical protein
LRYHHHRQTGYTFEKREPLYTFLAELPVLSEADLFTLSLAREPREKPVTSNKTIRGTTASFPAVATTNLPSTSACRLLTPS